MRAILNLALGLALLGSSPVWAGYTTWAVPTQVEFVNNGLLITGTFGNQSGCDKNNLLFVPFDAADEPTRQTILSMVLTAFSSEKELRFFSNSCTAVPSHWAEPTAVNKTHLNRIYVR